MAAILDPGGGDNRVDKFKATPVEPAGDAMQPAGNAVQASEEIGWRDGISPAVRLEYWAYLSRWKKRGEQGRRWVLADVACAHRMLDEAIHQGDEKAAAGYRKFLLLDTEIEVT